jgi:hypothetical protein
MAEDFVAGKTLALEVPEHGEDDGDVSVVETEAGAYRPAVEALRPPHPVEVDRLLLSTSWIRS